MLSTVRPNWFKVIASDCTIALLSNCTIVWSPVCHVKEKADPINNIDISELYRLSTRCHCQHTNLTLLSATFKGLYQLTCSFLFKLVASAIQAWEMRRCSRLELWSLSPEISIFGHYVTKTERKKCTHTVSIPTECIGAKIFKWRNLWRDPAVKCGGGRVLQFSSNGWWEWII